MTERNVESLPAMLDLMDREDIDKFYLSHLVYAGRGNRYREDDAYHHTTRSSMNLIFDRCWDYARRGIKKEFVTGNNDADGVFFLLWVRERFPDKAEHIQKKLAALGRQCLRRQRRQHRQPRQRPSRIPSGGTTIWAMCKERPFSEIWEDVSAIPSWPA